MCSARELGEVARELADVTSQHESVALIDPRTHLDYLDRFAALESARGRMAEVVSELSNIDAAIAAVRGRGPDRAEREAFLRYQLDAIDKVAPEDREQERLEEELGRLKHGARLLATASGAVRFLDGDEAGICDELGRIVGELCAAADIDDRLTSAADQAELCWSKLSEVSRDLAAYAERVDVDPSRLDEVQDRLFQLERLTRQFGPTIGEVLTTRARLARELDEVASRDARLPELELARRQQLEVAAALARDLSQRRRKASKRLGKALAHELADLGMAEAEISVLVDDRPPKEGEPTLDGARLTLTGVDRVEIMIAPNRGCEPQPLARVASGGELSRVLLALRRVLATSDPKARSAGIVVLDEIDAGIGGETADRIGRAIGSIACERQVLCVTHLASIAAYADLHFVVTKEVKPRMTTSRAETVDDEKRVAELARMLTGSRTGATERAAEDLLAAARRTRSLPIRAA
jgi:DNA repair protein RecN (Recombination protein N)